MLSKRLGKGLDALIPSLHINEDDKVIEVPVTQLRANPYQPRKNFDEHAINDLAASIKEHGVIQPIIVRSVLKGYEIIAGERRWRAAQLSGLATIPAVVRKFSDQQVMEIALIENLQREDLNSLEIALAYQSLIDTFQLTQEELSVKVGKSRSHIANFLRLLQLPKQIQQFVSRGTFSMGHAKVIAGMKNEKQMTDIAQKAIEEQWSVRELEERVGMLDEKKQQQKPTAKEKKNDPYIREQEEYLRETFRTSVKIKHQKDRGKIEFSYYTKEDLERLLEMFQGKISS